ncbi:hypothetical protein LTR36_008197 [Oleoguttula mirabilis]|uniref:DUF7703 domain-containing protein n=1 Tax=Oleoguttula mirabilis TaxID=1507867 RepID=A0AAV9J948_9PEZI|nr:hypothetical protein LTR36_008197 [Oleoguttula mirabilis]
MGSSLLSMLDGHAWSPAVQNNAINSQYPPFAYAEKVSLCLFFIQEVIISSLYIWETIKVLRISSAVKQGSKYRRMRNLCLANVAILALDVCLLSLEFAALWGVWCTFKGFAYSIKLRIEFAILNQLRDTITKPTTSYSGSTGTVHHTPLPAQQRQHQRASGGFYGEVPLVSLGSRAKCFGTGLAGGDATISGKDDQIRKTTEYTVSHVSDIEQAHVTGPATRPRSPSPSSSEIDFAARGA